MLKKRRISKEAKQALKQLFKDECCFKEGGIATTKIFEIMGFKYGDRNDENILYGYIRGWVNETIKNLWNIKPQDHIELAFQKFLKKAWKDYEPFGYLINGVFITPKTFLEWQRFKRENTLNQLYAYTGCIGDMSANSMNIYGIPAQKLLDDINKTLRLVNMAKENYEEDENKGEK